MTKQLKLIIGILCILLVQYGCAINQKMEFVNINDKTIDNILFCKDSNYVNHFVVKNKQGKLYVLDTINDKEVVLVKWTNGYISTGLFYNNKPFGRWCVFDKKSRLRRYLFFGNDGDFLLEVVEFNKRGEIIKLSQASVPFN